MGYTNPDRRIVHVSREEKRQVSKWRRLALKRELHGEHPRGRALGATRRGWWYA